MRRALVATVTLLLTLYAGDAFASCRNCRDLVCWLSEGTRSWCKPMSGGCMAGGTCGSADCGGEICGPEEPMASLEKPLFEEWRLVSVTVQSEKQPMIRIARLEQDNGK